jgi:hypothetical protein
MSKFANKSLFLQLAVEKGYLAIQIRGSTKAQVNYSLMLTSSSLASFHILIMQNPIELYHKFIIMKLIIMTRQNRMKSTIIYKTMSIPPLQLYDLKRNDEVVNTLRLR